MHYRNPFTSVQRRAAKLEYLSFKHHIRLLLDDSPPSDDLQAEVLSRYREHIRDIKKALTNPDRRVPISQLNESIYLAKLTATEYFRVKYFHK